jgi:hypothetical protein
MFLDMRCRKFLGEELSHRELLVEYEPRPNPCFNGDGIVISAQMLASDAAATNAPGRGTERRSRLPARVHSRLNCPRASARWMNNARRPSISRRAMPCPGNILEGYLKSERATPGYKASGWGLECPNMNPHEGNRVGRVVLKMCPNAIDRRAYCLDAPVASWASHFLVGMTIQRLQS